MRPGCVEGGVTNSSRGMIRRAANDEFPSLTPRSSLLLPFPFRYLLLFFSFLIFVSSFLSLSLSLPPPPPLYFFFIVETFCSQRDAADHGRDEYISFPRNSTNYPEFHARKSIIPAHENFDATIKADGKHFVCVCVCV